jgi:acetyl-CoA carboxylase biotin carboxyl carrier protein
MPSEQRELVYSLTYKEVVDILKIIDESFCQELRLELDDFKLEVIKGKQNSASVQAAGVPPQPPQGVPEKSPSPLPLKSKVQESREARPELKSDKAGMGGINVSMGKETTKVSGIEVKTPLSGTFYRASAPGARPFVEVGSQVEPGDQVAIVEVMKLMNSIKAPGKGIVRQILVENETMVKMGQTLMIIEPN